MKKVAFALALVISLSVLSVGQGALADDERMTITYWGQNCGNIVDDNYCEKIIQDALDIEIIAKKVDHTEADQVNLMLSTGEMPDVAWLNANSYFMFDENEIARTIPYEMVEKYAPHFAKIYSEHPILHRASQTNDSGDELYCLLGYQPAQEDTYFGCSYYRMDWLRKAGLLPDGEVTQVADHLYVADTGFTLDQFIKVMDYFTNGDPDGNGQNDTVGMLGAKGYNWYWTTLLGAYGLTTQYYLKDENGNASKYYSMERYKEFLKFAHKMYENGYIDKEIFTLKVSQYWEKATMGKGGFFCTTSNYIEDWASQRPPLTLMNQGVDILITPGEIGPYGDWGTYQYNAIPADSLQRLYINKDVDDKKLAKILEMLDYVNYGENRLTFYYGEEGVDYTIENGRIKSGDSGWGGERGIYSYVSACQDEEILNHETSEEFEKIVKWVQGSDAMWVQHMIRPYRYDLQNTTELQSLGNEYGANISTAVEEFFVNAITGVVDIDEEWDNYLKTLNDLGYDKIYAEAQKAPLYLDLIK